MKLPPPEALIDADQRFLYDHDRRELHNDSPNDFSRQTYLNRYNVVLDAVSAFAVGRRTLDIGCAQGNFSLGLGERGYEVVALDLRLSFLRYVKLKYEKGEVSCVKGSLEALPFRHGAFDVVLLGEVIEHVAYPSKLLDNINEVMRPGGLLVLTTPNGGRIHTGLPTLGDVHPEELVARQFKPDADGHLFLLTQDELVGIVEGAGMQVVSHAFFGSPWITGRLMARYIDRFLPLKVRVWFDRMTVKSPVVARMVSDGQVVLARKPEL